MGKISRLSAFFRETVRRLNFANLVVCFVLILISYQFIYPLLRMISLSMMGQEDVINPIVNWIPQSLSFGNFRLAWWVLEPIVTIFNSIWFSGLLALAQTLVAATTGYALARFAFPFKKFWFFMIIVLFILPAPIVLIPQTMMVFSVQQTLGISLIGTAWPQLLMAIGGQGVFSAILILIFYNFTKMIPPALDEAAAIDGANAVQTFWHVILKLSISTLLVVFLFSFVWNWNETYITQTFLRGQLQLVTIRLAAFEEQFRHLQVMGGGVIGGAAGEAMGEEGQRMTEALRMTGTLIAIFPLFVLYVAAQKQFIKGIENTGLTGL